MTDAPNTPDRRPIAMRRLAIVQRFARSLAGAGVSPNAISIFGMVAGLGAGLCLATTGPVISAGLGLAPDGSELRARVLFAAAAVLIAVRLTCNMLDGMVAVEGGKQSRTGEMFNEVPDRVSDTAGLVGAGFAAGGSPWLGLLAACGALFVTYVRALGKGCGQRSDFCGPMAKQERMAILIAASLFLSVAPDSWRLTLPPMLDAPHPGLMFAALVIIVLGCVVTGWRRLSRLRRLLEAA